MAVSPQSVSPQLDSLGILTMAFKFHQENPHLGNKDSVEDWRSN